MVFGNHVEEIKKNANYGLLQFPLKKGDKGVVRMNNYPNLTRDDIPLAPFNKGELMITLLKFCINEK